MILREFINLLPVAANGDAARAWAAGCRRPAFIGGREVSDDDINMLSFANYMLLASCGDDAALIRTMATVFAVDLYNTEAAAALGYIMWVAKGVDRINKLFAKTKIAPTDDERAAGVDKLRFGFFGIVDWYARRMNIDHAAAEATPWIRVYKCLDMETRTALYERRLMDVRMKRQKSKTKKGRKR